MTFHVDQIWACADTGGGSSVEQAAYITVSNANHVNSYSSLQKLRRNIKCFKRKQKRKCTIVLEIFKFRQKPVQVSGTNKMTWKNMLQKQWAPCPGRDLLVGNALVTIVDL